MLFNPFLSFSQDSIPAVVSIDEKQQIAFQESFFKALSEKSINHYKKAIGYLENCNTLLPNNTAVLFELSKNYYELHKTFEAAEFAKQALKNDAENVWILEHLIAVYKKERNFVEAIKIQEKIIATHPKKREQLVFLYLQNRDIVKAKKILQQLEDNYLLSARLRRIKNSLQPVPVKKIAPDVKKSDEEPTILSLKKEFKSNRSFQTLKKLLIYLCNKKDPDFLEFSNQGLQLFPAQPFVYFMNGKALNNNKQYKKALESLENGIDFVIDNIALEKQFYLEMITSHKGLGKKKEVNKYRQKIVKLK